MVPESTDQMEATNSSWTGAVAGAREPGDRSANASNEPLLDESVVGYDCCCSRCRCCWCLAARTAVSQRLRAHRLIGILPASCVRRCCPVIGRSLSRVTILQARPATRLPWPAPSLPSLATSISSAGDTSNDDDERHRQGTEQPSQQQQQWQQRQGILAGQQQQGLEQQFAHLLLFANTILSLSFADAHMRKLFSCRCVCVSG